MQRIPLSQSSRIGARRECPAERLEPVLSPKIESRVLFEPKIESRPLSSPKIESRDEALPRRNPASATPIVTPRALAAVESLAELASEDVYFPLSPRKASTANANAAPSESALVKMNYQVLSTLEMRIEESPASNDAPCGRRALVQSAYRLLEAVEDCQRAERTACIDAESTKEMLMTVHTELSGLLSGKPRAGSEVDSFADVWKEEAYLASEELFEWFLDSIETSIEEPIAKKRSSLDIKEVPTVNLLGACFQKEVKKSIEKKSLERPNSHPSSVSSLSTRAPSTAATSVAPSSMCTPRHVSTQPYPFGGERISSNKSLPGSHKSLPAVLRTSSESIVFQGPPSSGSLSTRPSLQGRPSVLPVAQSITAVNPLREAREEAEYRRIMMEDSQTITPIRNEMPQRENTGGDGWEDEFLMRMSMDQ